MTTVSTNKNAINLQILWENGRFHQKIFPLNISAAYNSSAKNWVFFEKILNYIFVLVDNDTVNNSGEHFTREVHNLKNVVTKL